MFKNFALSRPFEFLDADTGDGAGSTASTGASGTDGGSTATAGDDTGSKPGANTPASDDKPKKYSDDDVNEIVKRKKAEWAKQVDESKKLEGMSDADRKEAEKQKAVEEAAAAKAELATYKMRDTARKMLTDEKVPVSDKDLSIVVTSDADTTKANVSQLIDFAKRVRKSAEHDFLNGEQLHKNTNKAGAKGTLGEQLAKTTIASSTRPNPYFQTNKQSK
ncbi:DUF4355 domain-containing protein [Lacticaseibacillus zhaodongensis]|uniref:DUF4355 domain-containing protein n=1 Tax=Lacticaseibacillus zhaodongensis TaxID=2668065 RepID=UPI0018AF7110|nr:DUF4355 domain-containing protein [Lacticaseibacillus zhaodongensis]